MAPRTFRRSLAHGLIPTIPALLLLLAAVPGSAAEPAASPEPALEMSATGQDGLAFLFPQDVVVTWFEPTFGYRRPGGRVHHGVDLMAPKMTPVYAVADGIVTTRGDGRTSGHHLALDHGGGWTSWYMHLNDDTPGTDDGGAEEWQVFAPGTEIGSLVSAGQLIGYVGDSGNAEGTMPHTHFELWRDGGLVDPYPLLVQAQELALAALGAERRAELLALVDPQLRLAASSSSATLAATWASRVGWTTADSLVAVGGGIPSITHIDR